MKKVTLKLEPMFKRSITYVGKDDTNLGDEAVVFGSQHEFGDITWFPSEHRFLYRFDDRVPTNTPGDGLYDYLAFQTTDSVSLAADRNAGYRKIGLLDTSNSRFLPYTLLNMFTCLCRGNSGIKK